jgi:ATP-dependent Clp protease ATP-binding subunit ClpA
LGTTNKEFKDNIEHNEAFVDRCKKVDFIELSDADSKKILQDKVELDQERTIEIDAECL